MIDFKKLEDFYGIPVEKLKKKTYQRLENMQKEMAAKKLKNSQLQNAQDAEYARIIRKYFTPYEYLLQWFSDEEIIMACIETNVQLNDITSELPVRKGNTCWRKPNEFIESRNETLPRYTKSGERLMEGERTLCDVYRIKNTYQSVSHGKVFLKLLYDKWPELMAYDFKAYGFDNYRADSYELYPKNNLYVPMKALMEKDIHSIIKRNQDYAKSYNHGVDTTAGMKERLELEETKVFFDVIRNLTA